MLEKYYEEIKQNVNVRENLSLLRGLVKEEEARTRLLNLVGDGSFLVALLEHEEPKVRKNAALLLGDLGLQQAHFFALMKRSRHFLSEAPICRRLGSLTPQSILRG